GPNGSKLARKAAEYAATEGMPNAASLKVRALRPSARAEMLAAVGRFSEETLHRRFFAPKRSFSEREIEFFLNVDFENHVALAAGPFQGGEEMMRGRARHFVAPP